MTTTPGIPDPIPEQTPDAPQWLRLTWRDNQIMAEDIEMANIPVRYADYEFLAILMDFLKTAQPGDSMGVLQDRILRYR